MYACHIDVTLTSIYPKALGLGSIPLFVYIKKLVVCMAGYRNAFVPEKCRKP